MSKTIPARRGFSREFVPRAHCPHCGSDLSLCQPDEARPDRLLGSCPGCEAWYVVDGHQHVLVEVPLWQGAMEVGRERSVDVLRPGEAGTQPLGGRSPKSPKA